MLNIVQLQSFFLFLYVLIALLLVARVKRRRNKKQIVSIAITGTLMYDPKLESNCQKTIALIEKARARKPKALIVRVSSPGGTAAFSQQLHALLNSLRLKDKIKIVIMMEDVCASGGVYISMASDYIYANPSTVTGSIGVIFSGYDFSEIMQKIGIGTNVVKTGLYKDIGSTTRKMDVAEMSKLHDMLQRTKSRFCEVIQTSRKLTREQVDGFATGMIFTGDEAKEYGLIDDVGSFDDAVNKAGELAGIPVAERICEEIAPQTSFSELFQKLRPFAKAEAHIISILPQMGVQNIPLYYYKGNS